MYTRQYHNQPQETTACAAMRSRKSVPKLSNFSICLDSALLLCYGWILEHQAHLAAMLILRSTMDSYFTGIFDILSSLLMNLYSNSSATVIIANNLFDAFQEL